MNAVDGEIEALRCVNHPSRETYLRCGKCERPICPRCTVTTPVGARCVDCAQLRRLPQYEVGLRLVAPSFFGGLAVSAVGWYVLAFIPFFRFFAAVFLGIAIGDVMSRLAKRRISAVLQVLAVVNVALGWVIAEAVVSGGQIGWIFGAQGQYAGPYLALPLLLAAYFAYSRLR